MSSVAYWEPPEVNPNFISRPPDPGLSDLFKTIGWESLYHSPFYATKRFSELTLEDDPDINVAGRILDPIEATQKYGLNGQLKFDEPIKEEAAQLMYRRKIDENDRAYLISSGQTTGMRKASSFAVGMAASLLDPVNFASMFIPVVGEARIARFAKSFGGSVLKQRLVAGAATGLSGSAMVEPFILLPALQEQANYDLRDSALNLGFGIALGGMFHAGLGAVGDRIRRLQPKDADVIFETAMNDVLQDRPVVTPAKVEEFTDKAIIGPDDPNIAIFGQDDFGADFLEVKTRAELDANDQHHSMTFSSKALDIEESGGAIAVKFGDGSMIVTVAPDAKLTHAQIRKNLEKAGLSGDPITVIRKSGDPNIADVSEKLEEITARVDEIERISSAAYRLKDGTILTGKGHPGIIMEYGEAHLSGAEDGFMTNTGRFVSREDAAEIAKKADQVKWATPRVETPEELVKLGIRDQVTAEDIPELGSDGYADDEARTEFLEKQDLNAAGIPRRDAKGRFLSKTERLEILNQKLQEDALAAERAKQESRTKNVNTITKEISSRLPKDDLRMTGESAKDTQTLESEIAEIEKALDLTPEEKTRLREDIKEEAGDQSGREKGIVEGIKCIIKNLI